MGVKESLNVILLIYDPIMLPDGLLCIPIINSTVLGPDGRVTTLVALPDVDNVMVL
jgi:hypothetical protein